MLATTSPVLLNALVGEGSLYLRKLRFLVFSRPPWRGKPRLGSTATQNIDFSRTEAGEDQGDLQPILRRPLRLPRGAPGDHLSRSDAASFPNSRRAAWRYRYWNPVHLLRARRVIAISHLVADQLIDQGVPAA